MCGALPHAGGGASQDGRLSAGETSPGGSRPPELPGGTDGDRPRPGMRGGAGGSPGCPAPRGMEMDESSTEGPAMLPSQPNTPRARARTLASGHPSGMWFCPMPWCARRERASPTGWGCLQPLVSHLRSLHLSTGAAPPEAWLDAHGFRVCLACREMSPQGGRCTGPTGFTAVLAALDLRNTAPPAQAHSPLAMPLTAGLDLSHLLGTRIPTLRRVPIAASPTCTRALTCLHEGL